MIWVAVQNSPKSQDRFLSKFCTARDKWDQVNFLASFSMKIDIVFQALNYFAPFCLHLQSWIETVVLTKFLWSPFTIFLDTIHFAASSVQLLYGGGSYSTEAFIWRNTVCLTFTCLKHASYKMYLCSKKIFLLHSSYAGEMLCIWHRTPGGRWECGTFSH